jgi:hypothetical protein
MISHRLYDVLLVFSAAAPTRFDYPGDATISTPYVPFYCFLCAYVFQFYLLNHNKQSRNIGFHVDYFN